MKTPYYLIHKNMLDEGIIQLKKALENTGPMP